MEKWLNKKPLTFLSNSKAWSQSASACLKLHTIQNAWAWKCWFQAIVFKGNDTQSIPAKFQISSCSIAIVCRICAIQFDCPRIEFNSFAPLFSFEGIISLSSKHKTKLWIAQTMNMIEHTKARIFLFFFYCYFPVLGSQCTISLYIYTTQGLDSHSIQD